MARCSRRTACASASRTYCDPLPIWYAPLEQRRAGPRALPSRAVTQRPMAHVPFLGLDERLAAADPRLQPAVHGAGRGRAMGLGEDDWVWVESRAGRLKCQLRLMEGVNPDTVWTWNAIGKRAGAWGLTRGQPGSDAGLPAEPRHQRMAAGAGRLPRTPTADPVTGQAAWYDLRVRDRARAPDEAGVDRRRTPPRCTRRRTCRSAPDILRYNAQRASRRRGAP